MMVPDRVVELDREAAAIGGQTERQMLLGIEQPRVAGLRREEHQLTKRDDPRVRLGRSSNDVVNLAEHQIRLGWIQPRIPRVSAFLRHRGNGNTSPRRRAFEPGADLRVL